MSDSTQPFPVVRIVFDPYSHDEVQVLLKNVYREFGHDKSRWYFRSPDIDRTLTNAWTMDFCFRDPHDALMFSLKYSR